MCSRLSSRASLGNVEREIVRTQPRQAPREEKIARSDQQIPSGAEDEAHIVRKLLERRLQVAADGAVVQVVHGE